MTGIHNHLVNVSLKSEHQIWQLSKSIQDHQICIYYVWESHGSPVIRTFSPAEGQFQFLIKDLKSHNQQSAATHPPAKHTHTKKLLCKERNKVLEKFYF